MKFEEILLNIQTMTLEEKLALLSDTDKAYLRGYLDRVALDFLRQSNESTNHNEQPNRKKRGAS
jgi:hypothetical protein